MNFATIVKNIVAVATVAVPVLQNVLTAEQIIEGLVHAIKDSTLARMPTKPDGTAYTRADVIAAAVEAHAAWHAADAGVA